MSDSMDDLLRDWGRTQAVGPPSAARSQEVARALVGRARRRSRTRRVVGGGLALLLAGGLWAVGQSGRAPKPPGQVGSDQAGQPAQADLLLQQGTGWRGVDQQPVQRVELDRPEAIERLHSARDRSALVGVAALDLATPERLQLERGLLVLDIEPRAAGERVQVVSDDLMVTVIGTRFSVERDGPRWAVGVSEGRVEVVWGEQQWTLVAGQGLRGQSDSEHETHQDRRVERGAAPHDAAALARWLDGDAEAPGWRGLPELARAGGPLRGDAGAGYAAGGVPQPPQPPRIGRHEQPTGSTFPASERARNEPGGATVRQPTPPAGQGQAGGPGDIHERGGAGPGHTEPAPGDERAIREPRPPVDPPTGPGPGTPVPTPRETGPGSAPLPEIAALRSALIDGQLEEALAGLHARTSADPSDAASWSLLCRARERAGQPLSAARACQRAAEQGSGAQADRDRYQAGRLWLEHGNPSQAAAAFEAVAASPSQPASLAPAVQLHHAEALLALGQRRRAEALLRDLRARWPGTVPAEQAGVLLQRR